MGPGCSPPRPGGWGSRFSTRSSTTTTRRFPIATTAPSPSSAATWLETPDPDIFPSFFSEYLARDSGLGYNVTNESMGNREKLLEAATAILGRNGYQATSVDEILEAARVAPSNFYYHFKSKEELAIEVLEGYFEKSRQEMAPLFMNRSITATQKLERLH